MCTSFHFYYRSDVEVLEYDLPICDSEDSLMLNA